MPKLISAAGPGAFLLLTLLATDAAELPKKAPLTRYTSLWTNSPFTTKQKVEVGQPVQNPFDDLALKGIAPIASGYLITLINRKKPGEPVPPIDTDHPSEYRIIKVERDPDKPLGTVVHLAKGDIIGTVSYDDKLSVPKPPAAPKPGQPHPGQPPVAGQPVVPNNPNNPPMRQDRPRVVPPPTPPGGAAVPAVRPGMPGAPGTTARPGTTSSSSKGSSTHQRPTRH